MLNQKNIKSELAVSLKDKENFSDEDIDKLFGFFKLLNIKRKYILYQPGEFCNSTIYVNKGCMRRYIIDEHAKEITIDFALTGWWTGDLDSFFNQKPTIYYIQALENSELFLLSRNNYIKVCEIFPKYKEFHDEKINRNHYAVLNRLSLFKSEPPEVRYSILMQKQPQLFQHVPLHYIASYLGIEPESLSRLRKRLSGKVKKS